MAPPTSEKKMIALKSRDGQTFAVEEATARTSKALEKKMEDDSAAGEIALSDVDSATLAKILEYCSHIAGVSPAVQGEDVKPQDFNKNYVDSVKDDPKMLLNLVLAAYHLDIKPLLDLMCQTVAGMIMSNSFRLPGIGNDNTSDEKEEPVE